MNTLHAPSHSAERVILVSRAGKGIGGMQQLSRDLERGFSQAFGEQCISLRSSSILGACFLPLEVLFYACTAPKGSRLHFCDASLSFLGVVVSIFRKDIHVSLTACGLDVLYPAPWYQWLLRRSFSSIDRFASISNATAHLLRERGVPEQKISVIPCGVWEVATTQRSMRTSVPLLLTVGRLIPRKGVLWFLENVFPLLLERHQELQYWIVGNGSMQDAIQKHIKKMQWESQVFLHDRLGNNERDELYKKATLFIMPNIDQLWDVEGFGIVALEAGRHGLPVVAAKTGGIPDALILDVTGMLYEPGNIQDCVHVVSQAMERDWSREAIRTEIQKRYNWDDLIQRYIHEVLAL